jgi:hypothetical protein
MTPAPSSSPNRWHCPACGARLSRSQSADPAAQCLSCLSGHRFFVSKQLNTSRASEQASRLELSQLSGKSPEQVARFWLSDANARSHLNDQLAELLRVFLENRHTTAELNPKHCPSCGAQLSTHEQPDVWVKGLQCAHGHTWAERGTRLGGTVEGELVTFQAEPSNTVLSALAAGWLNHNPYLEPQLHESLRPVLEALLWQCRSDA